MKARDVREKYLKFFEKRGHVRIDPAPLVLEDDPTTLFISAGMQPLVPYFSDKKHPDGKRVVNSQPAIRLGDVEEVGNNRHETFFEMLGNWSFGDYFKKEQLNWVWEFLTEVLRLDSGRLWVSVFEGDKSVPRDDESIKIWKKIGVPEKRIKLYDAKKNWWSMTGSPDQMVIGDIGGPDSEIFYEFPNVKHDKSYGKECHPNCDCGRFIEIGNSVFIQYQKIAEGKLEELPQKNVDFGGGLERILAAVNDVPDIFQTDCFSGIVKSVEKAYGVRYSENEKTDRSIRIVTEHLRASAMLVSSNVLPSNKKQGYVLRRLLRRALFHASLLNGGDFDSLVLPDLSNLEEQEYPLELKSSSEINVAIKEEADKFGKSLRRGVGKLERVIASKRSVDGKTAFDLYQTDGIPLELTLEILEKEGKNFSAKQRNNFEKEFEAHKEKSRTAGKGMFKGGLADHSEEVKRFHTATHLLQAGLRKVLGENVLQRGQNITKERSRFDFSHDKKLTDKEILAVEKFINDQVNADLSVKHKLMKRKKAQKVAIGLFTDKYGSEVNVYYIGDFDKAVSREFCGGPHVNSTGEIGHVRIERQKNVGSGVQRVYLVLAD